MRNYREENRNAYDKKAHHYDHTFDGKFTEAFKDVLLANMSVRAHDSVLDVGCGNGTLLSKIAEKHTIQGFGVDLSPRMIQHAKARFPQFAFVVSGCECIPFADHSMDIVTVCTAYHHFPDVDAFVREAKRLLKPNGALYIAEIHVSALLRPVANFLLPLSKGGDVKFYASKEIIATFSQAGFHPVRVARERHIQMLQFHT